MRRKLKRTKGRMINNKKNELTTSKKRRGGGGVDKKMKGR